MPGNPAALCRDCLAESGPAAKRCLACGSPRLLAHPERDLLSIAHVDCDAFYAAVEKRDDPSLADKPVIIGGRKRGVVSTACYVARTYGVRSAMPMFKALKACPHAVVIKPNMQKYVAAGRAVQKLMLELTPLVEPVSIDEAFLDLSGTERLHHGSPARTLARLAKRIEDELGITVSIGLAPNKFLAKVASDLAKPRGFSIIGRPRSSRLPGRQADLHHSGHRHRRPGAPCPRGRGARFATCAKSPSKTLFQALGRDVSAPRPPRPGRGRSEGHSRTRDEERLGGDDLRHRSACLRGSGADSLAAVRERVAPPEGGGPRRSKRHLEVEGHGIPAHHAGLAAVSRRRNSPPGCSSRPGNC